MNNVPHILFDCKLNQNIRRKYWNIICEECPGTLAEELISMDSTERSKFLLNAFCSKFIPEWTTLYRAVLLFVNKVYMTYYDAIKDCDVANC